MGLDAYVPCNCYKEGKTKPTPFPEEYIFIDEETGMPELIPKYKDDEEKWNTLMDWRLTACDHEDMEIASERISNWGGLRYFQQALARMGWEHFPTLRDEIPDYNGGFTSPQASAKALEELKFFQKQRKLGSYPFLIDTERGIELREYTEAYDGIFIMDGRYGMFIGFDEEGLFFIKQPEGKLVFRAKRVEQQIRGFIKKQVVYTDLDTGKEFVCQSDIEFDGRCPRYMHVEQRSIDPSEFDYIIIPLIKVFTVSIETGNPVYWC
ncbi:MAG: hypothetical protein ACETWM_22075 [Candidatus Lokiarchaeia archaeon]